MASRTRSSENRRKRRHQNAGHKRKVQQAKASTAPYAEFFAACGEPGKPAPKAAATKR